MCTGLEIAAIVGAGASAAGGIGGMMGKSKERALSANALAWDRYNADRQYQLQTAGQRDARGNVLRYVPGWGWVSEPTPMTKQLLGAEDQEKYRQLTEDAPLRREAIQRNAQVGRELQSPLRDRIAALSGPRTDPKAFAGMVAQQAGNAVKSSADEAAANMGRIAARTGNTTSTGAAMAKFARERSDAVGDAVLNSLIKGQTAGENIRTSEDARLENSVTRLMSGIPAAPNFAPVPEGPTGPQPKVGGGFDTSAAMAANNRSLIPLAGSNPLGGLAELGILTGSMIDVLGKQKKQQTPPEWSSEFWSKSTEGV